MTDLEMLKKMTGESDDELLSSLLQMAEAEILSLTNRSKITAKLKPAVIKWALIAYNRQGMEGEASRSEGGISSSFVEIPKEIQDAIKRYRLGRVCGHAYEAKDEEEVSSEEENPNENQ